jgi:hypothetical protein
MNLQEQKGGDVDEMAFFCHWRYPKLAPPTPRLSRWETGNARSSHAFNAPKQGKHPPRRIFAHFQKGSRCQFASRCVINTGGARWRDLPDSVPATSSGKEQRGLGALRMDAAAL